MSQSDLLPATDRGGRIRNRIPGVNRARRDPNLAREQGTAMAREARAHGQDVLLAPGVNIIRTPHSGRNFEYYSEDPHLSARVGVAYLTPCRESLR